MARTINVICDNALLSGFAAEQRPVGPVIVEEVSRDFDLVAKAAPERPQSRTPQSADAPRPTLGTRPEGAAVPARPADGSGGPPAPALTAGGAMIAPDDAGSRDLFTSFGKRRWFSFRKKL